MMNQTEIGKFIAKCRKDMKLTQAQLAEKLNITDRAISKWETGKAMPDSSIMLELCEILGITVDELLSGKKTDMHNLEKKAEQDLIDLKRKGKNNINKNIIFEILSSVFLLGILVCLICDIAISGGLTWSLIPIISIIFAWVITFPSILFGKRGIVVSLISFSVFIIPYLFVLSSLTNVNKVFSIGVMISVVSIIFLWIIFSVFSRLGKRRKSAALGITFLLAIPFLFIVNIILSKMIGEPIFDLWDMLTVFVLLILAFVSFFCDYYIRKKNQ